MNLRTRLLITGGILGALLGVVVAYLYWKSTPVEVDEDGQERLPTVQPGNAIAAVQGVISAVGQIARLSRPA